MKVLVTTLLYYSQFHKTLPKSSLLINWIIPLGGREYIPNLNIAMDKLYCILCIFVISQYLTVYAQKITIVKRRLKICKSQLR